MGGDPARRLGRRDARQALQGRRGPARGLRRDRAGRKRVCLEIYIFHSDDTGWSFANLLAKRAREGLDVSVLYDSFGCIDTKSALFETMRSAGVRVREFHPLKPWRAKHGWHVRRRDHRKLLVVDDQIGVLGGQNLGDQYGSSWVLGKTKKDAWRDTAAGLRGPSVALPSEAFARQWRYVEQGGPIESAELYHSCASFADRPGGSLLAGEPRGCMPCGSLDPKPSVLEVGEDCVGVLASVPSPRSALLPALQKLLRDARSSIEMTIAYFAPPDALVEQLCRSARDGVRVRLMLPGRSDVWLLRVAAHAFYEKLMDAGVEVYERQHAVLHAKTLCVDGRVSIVGSTNLDYRSIEVNCELSVGIHSKAFGAQVHDLFEHDVLFARRILPVEWRRRPRRDRLVQRAVWSVRRWL